MRPEHGANTLVIGAGQAGLAVSRWLQRRLVPHVVLERGRIGSSWRDQRWDTFRLNTPNSFNLLPDDTYQGDAPFGFAPADALVRYFEGYAARHKLPIEEGVEVTKVFRERESDGFVVETSQKRRRCRNVVLCSGDQNSPRIPALSRQLPPDIHQLHTTDYRRPADLPEGAVLVVGSGQSGAQIAEDLIEGQRVVYLSTSAVARAPRRYRGKDIQEWLDLAGVAEQRVEDLEDPGLIHTRPALISGTRGGHTLSLQQLARDGATLLGRLASAEGRVLRFDGDLEENVAKGDETSAGIKEAIDGLIEEEDIDAPEPVSDPGETPFDGLPRMAAIRELDMNRAGIRSVIWATGLAPRFDFLAPDLLDENGRPHHRDGVCEVRGLYCVGFVWLRRRISGLIAGVDADARHVADQIAKARVD